jgi:hypothetical protein
MAPINVRFRGQSGHRLMSAYGIDRAGFVRAGQVTHPYRRILFDPKRTRIRLARGDWINRHRQLLIGRTTRISPAGLG